MTKSRYAEAGVDIDAKAAALARAKTAIRSTFTPGVLGDVGGFGGLFRPDFSGYREPVLVGSTDGVGTKLKVAIEMGRHDKCGADLVNHCVNDILVQGGRPLFFLDYIATGKVEPGVIEGVIDGIARACRENGTALLGGETAEMPGFYAAGEYDLAGTIVGVVDRAKILDGSRIAAGDVAVGLPSVGLQTNGYALARKVFFQTMGRAPQDRLKELGGRAIGDVLLDPHLSYLRALEPLLDAELVHGMAHITGGGFYDNIPRVLPEGLDVAIKAGAWPVLPVFEVIRREGGVSFEEMHRVFNMGIGMVVFVAPSDLARAAQIWKASG
ncbi:MAG: phosphoribosylformylglycinamidine cyclo-ligase, partial [Thermoanaerobaculia bacterium]